jgi:hypothetical protein
MELRALLWTYPPDENVWGSGVTLTYWFLQEEEATRMFANIIAGVTRHITSNTFGGGYLAGYCKVPVPVPPVTWTSKKSSRPVWSMSYNIWARTGCTWPDTLKLFIIIWLHAVLIVSYGRREMMTQGRE